MADSAALAGRRRLAPPLLAAYLLGAGVLVWLAYPLVARWLRWISRMMLYPYPADGLEGTLLSQAHLLWSGKALYQPFERYAFVSAPYPPWHPLILGFADQFAGPHVFWSGRVVSLVAGALVLLAAGALAWYGGRSWAGGLLAVIFLISAPPFALWATRIKPDMYALLWTSLGLLCAGLALRRGGRAAGLGLLAALCFALAFFTKQTALAAPLAAGCAMLLADLAAYWHDRSAGIWRVASRRTLAFGLGYLALVGVAWLLLDGWSGGQFTFHIWTQHRNAAWSLQLMWKYVVLLAPYWPMLLLALGVFALARREPVAPLLGCYLLLVPFTLLGAGKTGANHNHLLESLLALALGGGVVLGHALRRPPLAALVAAAVALQLWLCATPPAWYGGELVLRETPERYVAFIRSIPGEVLADDPGLLYMVGKPLRYDDPSGFGPVAFSGLWDQSGLVDDIRQRRFAAILIPPDVDEGSEDVSGRWTPQMLDAIRASYRVLFRDTLTVYVPRE